MTNSTQTKFNTARVPNRHENHLSRVKNAVRKAAALFVFAAFVVCAATPAMAAGLMKITEIQGGGGASRQEGTGDDSKYVAKSPDRTVYFGSYWQNPAEGYDPSGTYGTPEEFDAANWKKEGIRWRVLSNDRTGTGTKQVLLLADQGLYATSFDASSNVWSDSVVRKKLNNRGKTGETNAGFAGDAFSEKEWGAIANTSITEKGVTSDDKLFLLSSPDVQVTGYGFTDDNARIASPTAFAKSVKMYGNSKVAYAPSGTAIWWLRSPFESLFLYVVSYSGYPGNCTGGSNADVASRAAFNLNQESVLFLSAAVGGKSTDTCNGAFGLDNTYSGNYGWKVTLKDNGIAAPTDVTVTQAYTGYKTVDELAAATPAGKTMDLTNGVTMSYNNAPIVTYKANAIGVTANYVSAVIVSGDKYINYAKISDQSSETDKEIGFDDLADGTYKMFVFAEAENGDKQTDYASDFGTGADGVTTEFTIYKGSSTVNEGKLSKAYKNRDLTVNLGGGFNLGFDNDTYATKIIVVDKDSSNKLTGGMDNTKPAGLLVAIDTILGTEIASETDGTMLEKVTVNETAALACCGKIISMDLTIKPNGELTIEDDAVIELKKIQMDEYGTISMKENATLINHSGEKITVWDISKGKSVHVESGYYYTPSSMDKPEPSQEKPYKGGSSSGCNAGFGIAMLLSAATAMLCKRKRG